MIAATLVGGLAGLWIWVVLNDEEGILSWLNRALAKHPVSLKWMTCPWCSGAWFAGAAAIAVYHPSIVAAVVVALAAAAVTVLIGSYLGE